MFVCRVLASFDAHVPLAALLPVHNPALTLFEQDVVVSVPHLAERSDVKAFPRAAQMMRGGDARRKWRNEPCSKMPNTGDFTPWYVWEALDEYNTMCDSILTLELVDEFAFKREKKKKFVCIGIQNKEHKGEQHPHKGADTTAEFRRNRVKNMTWFEKNTNPPGETSRNVNKFLSGHHFVHVLATPNQPPSWSWEQFNVGGATCVESLLTHDTVRKFCPMVAYSGCDAHVQRLAEKKK